MLYRSFRSYTPVNRLFIVGTDLRQCCGPASTTNNSQFHSLMFGSKVRKSQLAGKIKNVSRPFGVEWLTLQSKVSRPLRATDLINYFFTSNNLSFGTTFTLVPSLSILL